MNRAKPHRLLLETLSDRITPAITFTNVAGHFTIIGDDNDNFIDVAVGTNKNFILRSSSPNSPSLNTHIPVKGTSQITVQGNGGEDFISIAALGSLTITSPITVEGGAGNDTLVGSSRADVLDGGDDRDSLFGGAAKDTLLGGAGNDFLTGSLGNDFINGGDDVDTIIENGNVNFTLISAFNSSLTAGALGTDSIFDIEIARLFGGAGNNTLNASAFLGSVFLDGGAGNDILTGGQGNDTLTGGNGSDSISGSDGDDILDGGTGKDTLRGGSGNDSLTGGFGVDQLDGGSGVDSISEAFDTSASKTLTLTNSTLRLKQTGLDETDSLIGINKADLRMTHGNSLFAAGGFDGPASLTGGNGNDTFIGGAGDDVLDGAGGVDRVELTTLFNATLTDDTLTDSVSTDALANFELATIRGRFDVNLPKVFDATGCTFRVRLEGGPGNDTLKGGSNNDTLLGAGGIDTLEGNDGNDSLDGGTGADKIFGGNGNDTAPFDSSDFVDLGPGEDGFVFQGTDGDDVIVIKRQVGPNGTEAVVELNGDTFVINYIQGETVSVFGGNGNDVIVMDASAGDFWKGHFFGEAGDDTLVGRGKSDYLDGGIGNDSLYGGDGEDVLVGGTGKDLLDGQAGSDVLISLDLNWIDSVFADADDTWHKDNIDRRIA